MAGKALGEKGRRTKAGWMDFQDAGYVYFLIYVLLVTQMCSLCVKSSGYTPMISALVNFH